MTEVLREHHRVPDYIERAVTNLVGRNRFGEPNARWVWGWARLAWIAGKFEDRDEHGNLTREVVEARHEPKYRGAGMNPSRWYFEVWMPPETYGSPEMWYQTTLEIDGVRNIQALGPYPHKGDYEHSFTLDDGRGNYISLDLEIARRVAYLWLKQRNAPRKSSIEKRSQFEAKQDADYHTFADAVLTDAVPAFHSHPFVTVPKDTKEIACP